MIRERVAGMEYARRHGTKSGSAIGRPKRIFDRGEVHWLREAALSIERIADPMQVGVVAPVSQAHAIRSRRALPGRPTRCMSAAIPR